MTSKIAIITSDLCSKLIFFIFEYFYNGEHEANHRRLAHPVGGMLAEN
jgi:hypothetical protein